MPDNEKLTVEQLIDKYPDMEVNENCLRDMICPNCGQRDKLKITSTIVAEVYDSGTDRDESDCEWEDNSQCVCPECGKEGTVNDFTFHGLDVALSDLGNRCTRCGEPADNGEGWNGLCGACADKAEKSGESADQ